MRELYATELRGADDTDNDEAWEFVHGWAERNVHETEGEAHLAVETASDGQRLLTLTQADDGDPDLSWVSEVGLGQPGTPLYTTVRVRLAATPSAMLTPVEYEFGTPTVVRTLLRAFPVFDAGEQMSPTPVVLGHSSMPRLVEWLLDPSRRLPVVVVSRTLGDSRLRIDVGALSKELAGLAHVRVLASELASWNLTDEIGAPLSAWDGAVRAYFPGFSVADDPYRHRLWFGEYVTNGLVARLRGWLGAMAASRVAEHPVHEVLRVDRREALLKAIESADQAFVTEYIDEIERENGRLRNERDDAVARNAEGVKHAEQLSDELAAVRRNYADVQRSMPARVPRAPVTTSQTDPLNVALAVEDIERHLATRYYAERVGVTDRALDSARDFASYNDPAEMLRAVHTVLEAGALYHDNRLGTTPMEYFSQRGFGYGAQPSPHLKVDEATSPDQCLRIYWEDDTSTRTWTITHIGSHL